MKPFYLITIELFSPVKEFPGIKQTFSIRPASFGIGRMILQNKHVNFEKTMI
jgi:hypothetical protein